MLEALASSVTNKYASGYPGERHYPGCEIADEIEQLAIDRAKVLFGAEHANVQPYAGTTANEAVYLACLEPGDTILSLPFAHGGHPTHGEEPNLSGKLYNTVSYGVRRDTFLIDYDQVRSLALEHRPRLIICGGSAYPRIVQVERFREIADEVGALLLCDMAHFAGLVAAGLHPNPAPLCDFVTSTTHKTLAGPRGGFILCKHEHARALDEAVFPVLQGGPLLDTIAAKAICFEIAASQGFADYQRRVRANADRLAAELAARDLDPLTGGTDTHLLVVDLRSSGWTGAEAESRLHEVGVSANEIAIPFDERPAKRDLGPAAGLARRHQARLRRGGHDRGGGDHQWRSEAGCRPRRPSRAFDRALREASALSGLPRLLHLPTGIGSGAGSTVTEMNLAPQLAAISMPREVIFGFVLALVIALALTPAIGSLARRIGAVDEPGERRLNELPIPRLGGIALYFAILVPALAFLDPSRPLRAILIGASIATVVGAIDDARDLVWWQKLGGQVLAAGVTAGLGVYVDHFTLPVIGVGALPKWFGITVTILWIVAIMNMVNFLDGLDGLAAGVCAISALTFCLIALSLNRAQPAILSAIVFGAALGFLRHNFYPARIFMGDSGALLLGFVLAAISVEGLFKTAAAVALAFPLIVLAIPILDTSFVVAKRIKHGKPIYSADRFHLHHRFIDRGFTQRQAVLTMYLWCATLAGAALATRFLAPHAHGHWQLWPSIADGAIGFSVLAASAYIVYVLEIVRVASPRARRRARREAQQDERRSA